MKTPKFIFLAGAMLSSALAQPYFPLESGNSWLYRLKDNPLISDRFRSISVEAREMVNGVEYFNVHYFGRLLLLRFDAASGVIVALDRQSNLERPWLSPSLPEGATFPTTIEPCATTGLIRSRGVDVATPAGRFGGAVEIGFSGPCADAGTTRQVYVPSLGPVVQEETSFTGQRVYELVYASTGKSAPELAFTVSLDGTRFPAGSDLNVRLTLRNTTPDAITLVFPSGQDYDLKIYNDKGDVVFTWSASRVFPMIYREEKFGPGERNWGITAPLNGLAPGHYRAQAYLATSPQQFLGEAGFDVVAAAADAVPNAARRGR